MILSFGATLRGLRQEKQYSQSQLAKKIGVSVSMIGLYENSERMPSFAVLLEIAKVFHVSTDYLLGVSRSAGASIDVAGLTQKQMQAVSLVVQQFQEANQKDAEN